MSLLNFPAETDNWHGFQRHKFQFENREAWIVEPQTPAAGHPWTWCLEWPEQFIRRTGVASLLEAGFHHVHIHATGHGNDEDLAVFRRFHAFLTSLGLAARPGCIGMSFGGLYAFRYAATYPGQVACIYVDAPLCSFRNFPHVCLVERPYGFASLEEAENYPGQPIFLADKLRDVPILYIYGEDDITVPAKDNAVVMIDRLTAAGNPPVVIKRPFWGHHPHGLDNPAFIADFIIKHTTR